MKAVKLTTPTGATRTYRSISATSRTLTGNGTNSKRMTISRRVAAGGGYVGSILVQPA